MYVTNSGEEKTVPSGKENAILTVCNQTIVTDQKIVTVTTVPTMHNSMTATTASASKTTQEKDVLNTPAHVTQFVVHATDQTPWTVIPVLKTLSSVPLMNVHVA